MLRRWYLYIGGATSFNAQDSACVSKGLLMRLAHKVEVLLTRIGLINKDVGFIQAFILKLRGYCRRIVQAAAYCLLLIVIAGSISLCVALPIGSALSSGSFADGIRASVSSALGLAYPVRIDEEGLQANYGADDDSQSEATQGNEEVFDDGVFLLCCIEVLVIALLSLVFSGSFSGLFLRPVNPIKMSPFLLFNEVQSCISLNVWICYAAGTMLQDVEVSVSAFSDDVYDDVCIKFGGKSPGAMNGIGVVRHAALRGVWEIRIPYDSDEARALFSFFKVHKDKNPGIQFLIKGTAPSGGNVVKIGRYDWNRFIFGRFDHALYHCPERFWNASPMNRRAHYINFARIVDMGLMGAMSKEEQESVMNVNPSTLRLINNKVSCEAKKWNALIRRIVNSHSRDDRAKRNQERARITVHPSASWNPYTDISGWIELIML